MKERVKMPGDHRIVSDPIPERKEFIKRLKKAGTKDESANKKARTSTKKECC